MFCPKKQERSLSQPGAKLQSRLSPAEAEVKPGLCCQVLGAEDGSEGMAAQPQISPGEILAFCGLVSKLMKQKSPGFLSPRVGDGC